MRKALFAVFSQFGEILDVVMRKRLKLRGQAFIAFRHQESATNSLRTMYGFPLFGMRMCIQYAKTDADAVTKMKGTFVPRPVTEKPRENPVPKKKVTATHKTPHLASAPGNPIASHVDASTSLMSSHHILFVTNLPDSSSSTMLSMLFSQFPGWREVRVVPGRPDIAFVEFDNDQHAAIAKNALDGFPVLPSHRMHVVFSSK
uniref:RRM domain-containing protein n=1 Tax=Eptatretus burgeri TaxID=7764 RepID=A0A8C4QL91_EPTBU